MKRMGVSYLAMGCVTVLLIGFGIHLKSQQPEMSLKAKEDAILLATKGGDTEAVKLIVKNDPNLANVSDGGGTLLTYAAGDANVGLVKALLDMGADPALVNRNNETPLYAVVDRGFGQGGINKKDERVKIIQMLAAHPNAQKSVNVKNSEGYAPLTKASEGIPEFVEELLKIPGIDVNVTYCFNGECFTPLMRASLRNNLDIISKLLAHGADVNYRNAYTKTALSYASGKVADALVAAGAKP